MYRYYGAAKNLPGVKELFEKPEKRTVRRTRHQMYKNIDMDYYGMRDDDDGVLVKLEGEAEASLLQAKVAKWEEGRAARQELGTEEAAEEETAQFVAHVEVPDQAAVQQAILARRKRELLASFAAGKEQEDAIEHADLADIKRLPPSW